MICDKCGDDTNDFVCCEHCGSAVCDECEDTTGVWDCPLCGRMNGEEDLDDENE